MPDTTIKTYEVPLVSNSTAQSNEAAVKILDRSLGYIESALNELSGQMALSNSRNAIIRHNVPIGEGVTPGMLVYYNSDPYHACFEPAVAELAALPGDQGESIESPKARVEGIIIFVDNSTATGTLLCGGYYESTAIAEACLGETAVAGTYYLTPDPTKAGQATLDTHGMLRQPVLSYYGNGKFSLSLFYLAHDNHFHTTAILAEAWTAAGEDAPAGAVWEYNAPMLFEDQYVGELSPITTAVFWNGILQPVSGTAFDVSPFAIANGKLYFKQLTEPAAGSVTIFNHFPFAYNSSVVRSIQSANDNLLKVTDSNGIVTLTPYSFASGETKPSATAISSIVDGVMGYTPVVPGINAGPGMTVTRALNGVTTVSVSDILGDLLDAHSIQNNGSTVITDGVLQFFTFPANRTSEFVMFYPVTDVPEGMELKASAWGTLYGPSTQLDVNGYFVPQPTTGNNTELPDTSSLANTVALSFGSGVNGQLSYAEVELDGFTITTPGMLVARVRPHSTPSSNIQLLRVGFKLGLATAPDTVTSTPEGSDGMVIRACTASVPIAAGQPVYINADGQLAICSANNQATAGLCVGIALTDGSSVGATVTYVISGVVATASSNVALIPGAPVYISTDGKLVSLLTEESVNTFYENAAYLQRVGTAVSTDQVQVHVESAILKGE